MKASTYTQQLAKVLWQRKQLFIGLGGSLVLNLGLMGLSYQLAHRYHIVVTPPLLEEAFWIEHRQVSSSYLQQMADYFCRLMLNATPASAALRRQAVLSLVDTASYGTFQQLLLEEETKLQQNNVVTTFNPIQVDVDVTHLIVKMSGELSLFQGKQQVRSSRKTYQIKFTFSGKTGKLLVRGMNEVEA